MQKLKVFISSVQKEFAKERVLLVEHFKASPFLNSFFEPILFEKLPANSQSPNHVYLDEVKQSQVYLVLLGKEYGFENKMGISSTELEYDHARAHQIDCIAFIKGENTLKRHEKESAFIHKIHADLSYKCFENTKQLILGVSNACITLLKDKGLIQLTTFDESLHPTASINDIDGSKIDHFIGLAQYKRGFPLKQGTAIEKVLVHMDLIKNGKLRNSALLAFAKHPQHFFATAVTKCAHFHGFRVEKPIPDHKVIQGDVFEQADQSVDFVLSKISVSVGRRDKSNQAPIEYEIPINVIREAIVNAIAHRDYTSNGSVQVMLFKDRLEISNPGRLTPELSISKLKITHSSYPTNPKLAEPMYQAGYIERYGTGTGEIIFGLTHEAGLKEPEFDLSEGFKVIIWRPEANNTEQVGDKHRTSTVQVPDKYRASTDVNRVILVLEGEMKRSEIQEILGLKHRDSFMESYLNPSLEAGFIEMTFPDKPNSSKQRYRLTDKGLSLKKVLLDKR